MAELTAMGLMGQIKNTVKSMTKNNNDLVRFIPTISLYFKFETVYGINRNFYND